MEGMLNGAADGSAKGLRRWYAFSHAARCSRCGRYLRGLTETIARLRKGKAEEAPAEVMERLAAGAWREAEEAKN
jgi:hypothetical protein